jgi:flagellar capping protein FliD
MTGAAIPGQGASALSLDYTGEQGGIAAMAHMAGWAAATLFWGIVGKFMWRMLGKAKDDTIAELKKTIEKNEERCAETIDAMQRQIDQLQMILFTHSSGPLRQDLQKAISEQRVMEVVGNANG